MDRTEDEEPISGPDAAINEVSDTLKKALRSEGGEVEGNAPGLLLARLPDDVLLRIRIRMVDVRSEAIAYFRLNGIPIPAYLQDEEDSSAG